MKKVLYTYGFLVFGGLKETKFGRSEPGVRVEEPVSYKIYIDR